MRETCAALATNSVPIRIDVSRQDIVLAMDPNRIRQALENVVSNAISLSAGATVVLSHVESTGAGCWAVVTVSDQGPGTPRNSCPVSSIASLAARGPRDSGSGCTVHALSLLTTGPCLPIKTTIGARFQMKPLLADAPLSEGEG